MECEEKSEVCGTKCMEDGMERKNLLKWYKEKDAPIYENWYGCCLGGDLF